MTDLKRLLQLPAHERWLLIQSAVLLLLVRAALWPLPFEVLLRWTGRIGQPARPRSIHRCHRLAVRRASRLVPGATCLTPALAGRILLGRGGHPRELRVGAAKSPASGFEAHAWLEHRGQVVLGGLDVLMRAAGNRF
jgi:Transglutaminase-like superfamily